jgi:spermidine synthase
MTLLASLILISLSGSLLAFFLFRSYCASAQLPSSRIRRWLLGEFTPRQLGGFSYRALILVSLFGLFLELLMIRWVSSEIRIFAYFKNFVLIACFLGFGLGSHLSNRPIRFGLLLLPLCWLALLIKLPIPALRQLVSELPDYLGAFSSVHIWSVPSMSFTPQSIKALAGAMAVVIPIFALISLLFVPIGQLVAWYLEHARRGITAYTVNVGASLAGILLYTLLCFYYQPPAVWFLIGGLTLVLLLLPLRRLAAAAALVFLLCAALAQITPAGREVLWSPYQKLSISEWRDTDGTVIGHNVNTNDSWYQVIIDLSDSFVAAHPHLLRGVPIEWNAYNLPYHFVSRPPSVLVLGAGTGNDVAAAVRNGAGRVVAVEIDPLILREGKRLHPERPYDSPRVHAVLDDARAYVQNSPERFDLILFSLLDSHTTSSHFSNIRIDNYVYTVEALAAAKKLLKPDGLLVMKFWVDRPWIAGRLQASLTQVFGQPPLQLEAEPSYTTEGSFFISGSEVTLRRALSDPRLRDYLAAHSKMHISAAPVTTDDWPFFYQERPGLPVSVALISIIIALVCAFAFRATGQSGLFGASTLGRRTHWHFFCLGAAFLLLEAQIVSKMALLFGTTWIVNSVVISALLLLIMLGNTLVGRYPNLPAMVPYAGIWISILVAYFTPVAALLLESFWLRAAVGGLVLCLPVLFASMIFIRSFSAAGFSGSALGSNLMGALIGGLAESISMATGLRSLTLLAGALYLTAFLCRMRQENSVAGALSATVEEREPHVV